MIREYESKNHSKFLMMYHIIFVCKYRRKVLEPISNELKQVILDIAEKSDFEIIEIETDKDHIHLLVKSEPKISALMIVRKLTQETTVRMWKTHSRYLSRFYWKERTLWNDGYFVCTIGNISKERMSEYIRNQG